MLLPDAYIWARYLRHVHWALQIAWWLPLLATMGFMTLVQTPLYQAWMFRVGMIGMLLFVIPKLLFMLISILGWLLHFAVPQMQRVMNIVGISVVAILLCIVAYGLFVGWKKLVVDEVTLTFNDLPADFDGYTIVQLSDFHIGTYNDAPECVTKIVDKVNEINPDMICFTGDLVNTSPKELDLYMDVLPKLKAKDGMYSIMGNHDYCSYAKYSSETEHMKTIRDLQSRERSFGWDLLLNENRMIRRGNDSILLAGVENSSKPPFPDYGDLKKSLSLPISQGENVGSAQGDLPFTILLSHDPTHWQREVLKKSKVQLQLSGHTHSTQFKIFGWSPASFAYKEYAGLYEMNKNGEEIFNPEESDADARKLFVCTGTGGNLSFRFGVWPEIVVIHLKRGATSSSAK